MITQNDVKMGELLPKWKIGNNPPNTVTFCVTEDCNLACKYCYLVGKNSKKKMTIETAKKAVDYVLNDNINFTEDSIVWDFIGGEPFLEIELIDQISDYIKQQMYIMDHRWFNAYRFSFSTNGTLYDDPKVQEYIRKNSKHISIGISIDGNKTKHDMQRVHKDGSGSYDEVVRNVPLWIEQFGEVMTKATFSSDDLPYLKDSITSLWDLGIKTVAANVVFEDVWKDGDDIMFENQLKDLADYVIENKLWNDVSVRFFDPNIGTPLSEDVKRHNYCGAGNMVCIDCDGKLFPCIRFTDFSLAKQTGLCIGDIENGINRDLLRPFHGLNYDNQSPEECINCDIAGGCAWCKGCDYDESEDRSIYKRTTYKCKMHKANVRANEYFWRKYSEVTGEQSPRDKMIKSLGYQVKTKYLLFITRDDAVPHCSYRYKGNSPEVMSRQTMEKGLQFAQKNGYVPVFIGDKNGEISKVYPYELFFINAESIGGLGGDCNGGNAIHVYDNNVSSANYYEDLCNLLVAPENVGSLYTYVKELIPYKGRINVIFEDIKSWDDIILGTYKKQLKDISQLIVEAYAKNEPKEINILTDRMFLKDFCGCDAGKYSFSIAPNGNFYICPGFYFENPSDDIGNLESGIQIEKNNIMDVKKAPFCSVCDAYQCMACRSTNKKLTGEINIPSEIQCTISHIERSESKNLQIRLIEMGYIPNTNVIPDIDYIDPIEKVISLKRSEA